MLDKKELSLTLDDFRTIFHLPQANDNNHNSFVPPPSFSEMVPFYKQQLGFTMELKTSSSFKTTGLLQPWQTLCKIFSKCLTTRVTGWDQPPLQIMQMMYCFVNNIHVDYAELLWEGIYYSLHHPTSSIPYLRFTKDHHWMITEEMKHTKHYRMYAEVFGLDVPLTQSQPTESTQGTHRTPSAPSVQSTLKRIQQSQVLQNDLYEMILQDTLQIEKMVEGPENVIDDSLLPRNDEPNIPGTRLEPRSDKESLEVEITNDKEVEIPNDKEVEITNDEEVEITNGVIPVNVNEEEEEQSDDGELQGRYGYLFEHLKARFLSRKSFDTLADILQEVRDQVPVYVAEGLILERQKTKEEMERMIAKAILQERGNIQAEISSQIQKAIDNNIPSQVDASVRSYMSGHILHVHPAQSQTPSVPEQQYQLYLSMKDDPQLQQQDIAIWLALQMKFESLQVPQTTCRTSAVRPRDQDDPHDDAHPEGENRAKRQKTSEYEAYVSGESSSGQVNENEQGPSTSGNQEQEDDYDFWTESYASDDDEIPTKQMSQDIMEEVSLTIDEAKLKKMADEMLRQRCTSGDEHQYHIDQMKNFLKSDIVWESRKEILVSPHPRKTTPLVQSYQRDPEAPALSLINQDLLYLKKGSSGPEKIVLSLHKFPAIIFNDDDIEERTSRWVNKKQKEPGKPKEVIYSNSKIIQVIKTYWELGHEHKFITEIVARRANECIVLITKPDYKNLNKNDIEDMYLLLMNGKVPDYAETWLLWSLSVFISVRLKILSRTRKLGLYLLIVVIG
ncbi:hypothetical protein Tco_0643894 [Tanacetum coccineum]